MKKKRIEETIERVFIRTTFKNLPKTNKTMLAIQYRMHESIMETITPFYEEENYRLQCGLTDSDAMRDHSLESQYIKRQDHLLWLDMPNEKRTLKNEMKDGKSRFNQAELRFKELLIDLNQQREC